MKDIYYSETRDHIIQVLYYSSTMIDPIIYSVMSKKFREAFKVRTYNF